MGTIYLTIREFIPLLVTLTAVLVTILTLNTLLRRRWKDQPDAQFRFQLLMLLLTLAGTLGVIVALPVSDVLQGQLLSLIGLLLSAAIALSSATFIGNILAGIMLKTLGNARPGDFITVANLTGRISEMDLLHTEVQTEFRDLVTVPNMYMVSQPLKVVRASGSIITAEVSLGFDVPHARAIDVLRNAAQESGLKDCFVHVRELGDFSVTYRAAGLLEDIQSLISARSALFVAMLDGLHAAGIEIVSPNFMTTRALSPDTKVLPPRTWGQPTPSESTVHAEDIAFDKAEDAASLEKLRLTLAKIEAQLNQKNDDADPGLTTNDVARLSAEKERVTALIQVAQTQFKEDERADDLR